MSDEVWHGAITPLYYTTRGKMLHDAHAHTHKMWGLKSQNYRYYKPWKAGSYYNTKVEISDVTHMCPPPMRPGADGRSLLRPGGRGPRRGDRDLGRHQGGLTPGHR